MSLARNRTKTTFLPILGFINSVLEGYVLILVPFYARLTLVHRNASAPQRYGALSMTSLLAPCMVRHPTVKPALETFLMTHILHEFHAPEGYMRYIVRLARPMVQPRLIRGFSFVGMPSLGHRRQV